MKLLNFCISLTVLFAFQSVAQPSDVKILNYYPSCVSETLDVIKIRKNVRSTNLVVSTEAQEIASLEAIENVKESARSVGAEAVILTKKQFLSPAVGRSAKKNNQYHLIVYTAELLKLCSNDKSLTNTLTPYSDKGLTQIAIGMVTIEEKTFQLPGGADKAYTDPELESRHVSLDRGLYGVSLGASLNTVLSKFGLPTATFKFANKLKMISYGRNHWLFFLQDKLVKISTNNSIFTQLLQNSIPFKDTFDDQKWLVLDSIEKGDSKKRIEEILAAKKTSNADSEITLHYDYGKVDGFTLQTTDFDFRDVLPIKVSSKNYDWLSSMLQSQVDGGYIDVSSITDKSLGSISFDNNTEHYVFDRHLLLTMLNDSPNQIVLTESFLLNEVFKPSSWSFEHFYEGQSKAEVANHLADNFITINNTIQIDYDSYSMRLFFYQDEHEEKLYKIEFNLF